MNDAPAIFNGTIGNPDVVKLTCILSKQLLDAVETPQGRIVVPRR